MFNVRKWIFAAIVIVALIFIVILLNDLYGTRERSRERSTDYWASNEQQNQPRSVASGQEGQGLPITQANGAGAQSATGGIRIKFETKQNLGLSIVVISGNNVERRHSCQVTEDPLTDPKYKVPPVTQIDNLAPGVKKIFVISESGYVLHTAECTVHPAVTTELSIAVQEEESDANQVRIKGTVVDSEGTPVQSAKVCVRVKDDSFVPFSTDNPVLLAEFSNAVSCAHVNEYSDVEELSDPYSEESYESLLEPYETPSVTTDFEKRTYSDGTIEMSTTTGEKGNFTLHVTNKGSYNATIIYGDLQVNAVVIATDETTNERNRCVLPIRAKNPPKFEDIYRNSMLALISKDANSYQKITELLKNKGSNERASRLLKRFEDLFVEPFDFYNPDLESREAYIRKARGISFRISMFLSNR